jgi:CMP-N,N'-diacetyllegionaminic acid synthase
MKIKKRPQYLVVIPARGGSKGIKGKNIYPVGNIPLIDYTIYAAIKAEIPNSRIVLSSDNNAIIENCKKFEGLEIPFVRPPHLATDTVSTVSVVEHTIAWYKDKKAFSPDAIILLQPTSPFRNKCHIQEATALFNKAKKESLISVSPVNEHPCECIIPQKNKFDFVMPPPQKSQRQNFPEVFFMNGAIYITSLSFFSKNKNFFDNSAELYFMDKIYSIDIDEMNDIFLANSILENNNEILKINMGIKKYYQ